MSRALLLGLALAGLLAAVAISGYIASEKRRAAEERLRNNLLAAGLQGNDETPSSSGPSGVVEIDETEFDFGVASLQARVSHSFRIRNAGPGDLRIKIKERSCTCILGELKKSVLPPGHETELKLAVDTKGAEARIIQGVTLETSDPQRSLVDLRLVGNVRREVWSDRSTLVFRDLLPGEQRVVQVPVFADWPEGFTIEKSESTPPELAMAVEPMEEAALSAAEARSGVLLKIDCPAEVKEFLGGKLTCQIRRNDSSQSETYSFDVEGNRLGLIGIFGNHIDERGRIQLQNIERSQGKSVSFTVKARGTSKELRVKEIRTTPEFVVAELQPLENVAERGLHQLLVAIPPDVAESSHQGADAGKIEIDFEGEYPPLVVKLEFAVVSDKPR